ncbi:hypothetical protein Pmani_037744 [Petrolisthes manimaculis]|uniref:Carbonic anhydrase n=1 Tax=Petrolisthes manimaculis TaxID=1843537 RepID=A0AAE1NHL7_9EUCA|nr:hypothetical protein Pmani_037744 [Petrolisthes manimaculis]
MTQLTHWSYEGTTAQVSLKMKHRPTFHGGNLHSDYEFVQFHFHWGSVDTQGSEHSIDGVSFPGELHLVHYRNDYGSLKKAIQYQDGLAVLGVMLQLSSKDNSKLQKVIDGLHNIHKDGADDTITPFALEDLLPSNTN